jgi:ferredoxin--NADP+ reductase
VAILGEGTVEAIELERNRLVPDGQGGLRAEPTGELEVLPCSVVFRSVGYRGVELPGVPFDHRRHTIRNESGRVVHEDGTVVPGVYCAGWIKRGPSGVIGTNKKDAAETVACLLADARAGLLARESDDSLEDLLSERGVHFLEYAHWEAIDEHERGLGSEQGRPRVKLATWDDLLERARRLPSRD